ncbi:MAG: SWIM zinc finger family protein [Ktedonobacterales bacterium]
MLLSSDQVLALAPDTTSAAAGKKLANVRYWRNLGQSPLAAWGECQGSALYQVRVELATFAVKCTCPSHKFPCKHGLGLLLLATDAKIVPSSEPPEWVMEWLSKRAATTHKSEKQPPESRSVTPKQDQRKRVQKREALVSQGLNTLDLWMSDLIRNGLASVETQGVAFWERQAAQLVDAQAPGVAGRVRQLAGISGSRPDWPDKLLDKLGRMALLTHAYRYGDTLNSALYQDVRQLIGWTMSKEELMSTGEKVTDEWYILGQWDYEEEKLRVQNTWLLGAATRRSALILQYSALGRPYSETFVCGSRQIGDLYFYPGAASIRGYLASRQGESAPISEIRSADETIDEFLQHQAELLARQPWQEHFLLVLRGALPVAPGTAETWYIRDRTGAALPLRRAGPWLLLALSGGMPLDFVGEWDGETVLPLAVTVDGAYHALWRAP